MRTRVASRNTALQNLGDEVINGFVRFYDGAQPTDPDTALSGNNLIVECQLQNPAFSAPSNGQRTSTVILPGMVNLSGTPTFARFFLADGVTAVVDMSVPGEITLSKADWVAGDSFPGPSITWSLPVGP